MNPMTKFANLEGASAMLSRKILSVAVLVLFLGVASGVADMGVSLLEVDVTDIPLDTPTTVTVSAMIGVDPALILSGIRLVQYDPATNRPVAVLAQMYDDGTHGDALPGDTRFTGQVVLAETEEGPIHLRVTAAYRRVRNRFMSDIIELNAFAPLTEEDIDNAIALLAWSTNLFVSLSQSQPEEQAAQETLEAVLADPEVLDAAIYDNWLVMKMQNGTIQVIVVRNDDNIDGGTNQALLVQQMLMPSLLSSVDPEKVPGNEKVMIWAPGYSGTHNGAQNQIADYARTRFENAAWFISDPYPPVITVDESADLDSVKHFAEYGTIIIHTHGNVLGNNSIGFTSGTSSSFGNWIKYAADLVLGRVISFSGGTFGFSNKFISAYVKNMPDSMLYLGACHSLNNDAMWDSFKNAGGKVSFGWSDSVCRNFNVSTFESLIDSLLPTVETSDPSTVQEAFDAIANKVDSDCFNDLNAAFLIRTAAPNWQDMYLVTPGIVNGNFETGDFAGWTTGGDYDYSVVTSHAHEGSYSAALGRWDQSYHGHDPSAEPYGYEWLYQDVIVPADATSLSFWYDIETYDTAVWDWVDMEIRDVNGAVLQTVLSHAGKPGYNYGPYWHLGWTHVEVDVTAFRGQEIRIRFAQRLDGWGDQQRCYFDEVQFIKE